MISTLDTHITVSVKGDKGLEPLRKARAAVAADAQAILQSIEEIHSLTDCDIGDTLENILDHEGILSIEDPAWYHHQADYIRQDLNYAQDQDADGDISEIDEHIWKPARRLARALEDYSQSLQYLHEAEKFTLRQLLAA